MKNITELSLIAATLAVIGTSAALAGDPQLENRLALQRQAAERNQKSTTIAVYANRNGVSQHSMVQDNSSGTRFEVRTNAHGEAYGIYVPAK